MLLNREEYLKKIRPYYGKNLIKVIVGQRRSGKSSVLKLVHNELKKLDQVADFLYINKELHKFNHIKTAEDLIYYVQDSCSQNGKTALFIDEIQDIKDFEVALRNFVAQERFDIYCSGSNSNLLSGELATLLTGRFVEFRVYTLAYPEFLLFHNLDANDNSLAKFFEFGGLPFLRNVELKQQVTKAYIGGIYKTVLLNDIVGRYNIRNPYFLEQLTMFCADNIGALVTAKKISDYLKSQRVKISPNTVLDYLQYFVNACFMHRAKRYDLKGKRILETNEKYYFEDIGIRNYIVGYKISDINKILESVVFHHLVASGYNVTVGNLGALEIDFVAERDGEIIYIQVCYKLSNENTIKREFGNLEKISDNYPKFVISTDSLFRSSISGIRHLNIKDFLLKFPF